MRVAGIREIREHCSALLGGTEPVVITRHGKLSGVYLPLDDPDRLPDDLRRELAASLGKHLAMQLASRNLTEAELLEDFDVHRRSRRRR